jgi:hypothetical protein
LGKGKFQRRDFRFDTLTLSSSFSEENSLFATLGKHEIFTPTKTYPTMTVQIWPLPMTFDPFCPMVSFDRMAAA